MDYEEKISSINYVDLGLPSGTLWADRNIGADKPEDFGDYMSFDEANSNTWICPLKEQIEELLYECKKEWTTFNDVNGYKIIGPNDASIFLPAAGYHWNNSTCYIGCYGHYWSSTRYPCYLNFAYSIYFYNGGFFKSYFNRYNGQNVRAIISK